jgi:predicted DNA-binding transcriptional regulator AlpA
MHHAATDQVVIWRHAVSVSNTVQPDILTLDETAQLIRRSPETLRYWRKRGEGPRGWKSGRRVLFDRADVLAWLDEQRQHTGGGSAA